MSVAFKGIGEVIATFDLSAGVLEGTVVSVNKEGSVQNSAANTAFLGVVRSITDYNCSVQVSGYMEALYSGAKPAYGNIFLASNGGSGVKVHTEGRAAHVVSVNEDDGIVGFFLI